MINFEPLYIPMREARLSPNWGSKNHSTIMGVCPHHNDTPHPEPRRNNLNVKMIDGVILAKCKVCGELPDFLKFIGMNTVEPESICLQDITPVEPVIMDSPVIELPQVKQETSITELPIEAITVDTRAQSRAEIDMTLVAEYAELMRDGVIFPPLTVLHDGSTHWLSEGFHRLAAYREAAFLTVPCIVKTGGLREAILLSVGSNSEHGKRRSNADKRRAVELLLKDSEWSAWSDSAISKKCAVDPKTVNSVREAYLRISIDTPSTIAPEPVRTATRNGTTYTVKTGNIGKVKPADKPEPEAKPVILAMQPDSVESGNSTIPEKQIDPALDTQDCDVSAYLKKMRDEDYKRRDQSALKSFFDLSRTVSDYCKEGNAESLKNVLIDNQEYYRTYHGRSVCESVSKVMAFLENKEIFMNALDEVLFKVNPLYERRVTTTEISEIDKLKDDVEKMRRSRDYWRRKIKDDETREFYAKQEQYWTGEPKEIEMDDPEYLVLFKKMREEQIDLTAKTYGLQRPMPTNVWRRLVQLTHPDKHGGSDAANDATQWLLKNRPPESESSND